MRLQWHILSINNIIVMLKLYKGDYYAQLYEVDSKRSID